MKKIVITQSNYIPWKGYFDAINMADELIIYDDMQYTKRDWRNRNLIKTSSGLKWLTIPVEVTGKFYQKINETKICGNDWAENHWSVLKQCYRYAPCFNEVKAIFEKLYMEMSEEYLSRVNYQFIKSISSFLEIKTPVYFSTDFMLRGKQTERLVDLCIQRGASVYYTGPAAKNYLEENLFREAGITLSYIDYTGYKEYSQLYTPFEHGVSILDLIFNHGKEATTFMKSFTGSYVSA